MLGGRRIISTCRLRVRVSRPHGQVTDLGRGAMRVLTMAALVLVVSSIDTAAGDRSLEYELKTEFIERFTRFVEWPPAADERSGPFVIGLIGKSPIEKHLERLARQRRIKGREATLVVITELEQIELCHLLFVSRSAAKQLPEILDRAADRPVLTISDSEGFCERGVLINLYREGQYLRFEVNLEAVERSGLRFSSNLLRLARLVEAE
jgi:hypothetical protein